MADASANPTAAGIVSPFYIAATASYGSPRPRVLKQGDTLAVLDDYGNAQAMGPAAQGLFFEDTRYLSQLVLTVEGELPLLLSSTVTDENTLLESDLTNPDFGPGTRLRLARDSVHILRRTVVGEDALFETLELRNFAMTPTVFRLELAFGADYVDMFEVRGTKRAHRGQYLPDERQVNGLVLAYRGLDKVVRRTKLAFDPVPDLSEKRRARWEIALGPDERRVIQVEIRCERDDRAPSGISRAGSLEAAARRVEQRKERSVHLYSSNETFNDWLNRSRADLDMLVTATPEGLYPYAGIPWFSTAFGRDGLITALECLWLDPTVAAGTLRFLAANQATAVDPTADAEPGKILHETRKGEMAALGEVPFGHYYGSVDSTPLFVMLADAYHLRTGDTELIRALWPHIEAALGWMTEYGDVDGDGFIEYGRRTEKGLANQGWKDSGDAIFHADGALAVSPIALVEVQAYAYAAYRGAARLGRLLGHETRAVGLETAAEELRERFEAAFWMPEAGTYALALDRDKRPCQVRASNAGHVLLGGLASPDRAQLVAAQLMDGDSYSDWGIRTLAQGQARYNPMSYHNGSVWPHDNGLIAMGFGRYGLKAPLLRVLTGMFDAALLMNLRRLPELFCGFSRRPGAGPTAYPVACLPQAWSSACVFGMLGAAIGISFVPEAQQIRFTRPALPSWLHELKLSNLRFGDASVDLVLERSQEDVAVHVVHRNGPIEIVLTT